MNLNDFVVLPNNKAKSVKLSARNLQELQTETVTLAQESEEMEEKLQQLKESMSKEKEERGHSGGFRWKSGQSGSLNSNALTISTKKNKENRLQKLSAGKVKIRVLKDESLTAPPQPPPPPAPSTIGLRAARKTRLRGTCCGQCEVKTAGIRCAECTEDYCVGCFARFHQKGALKLHRMVPIQMDLQTHVSTRDVVSCFQKQINPSSHPGTIASLNPSPNSKPSPNHTVRSNAITRQGDQSPGKDTEFVAKPLQMHPDPSQVLTVTHGKDKKVEMIEEGLKRENERGLPADLLRGEYNEEESARSFQQALRQWRGERSGGAAEPASEDAMWTPVRPVSMSAMATQADLAPDRGPGGQGRGGGEGKVPVRVEFTENSLTYMDRLLLKKHRRTPIEMCRPSMTSGADLSSLPNTEEEAASSLEAQEEDFRRYCASLFAVHVSRDKTEPQITTPESCLVIEVMDETDRDIDGDFVAEQRKYNNRKVPSVQQVLIKGRTPLSQTALTSGGSSRPAKSRAPAQPKAAQKPHVYKPHTSVSQTELSVKSSFSQSEPSACPIEETPMTKTSIKTPTSTSQKPNCSPTVHKSKPDHRSPRLLSSPSLPHGQAEIPKSSHAPLSFPPDVSPLTSTRPPIPEEYLSPSPSISLRSTFTVSPSGSTESTLLPKVYQSTPVQKGSYSSLLPEQPQSSQLFPEPISSLKLSQSPPSNLESSRQSQDSLCDPESLLSNDHLQLPLSRVSSCPNPTPKSPEPCPPMKTPSSLSLFKESASDAYSRHRSTPMNADAPVFISSAPVSGDRESTLSPQDALCIPSQNRPLAVKMEEEEESSIDSGDEMSSDSLDLAPYEEDSSDEEARMPGRVTRGRSREDEQGNPAISHQEDSFVPADAERENHLQSDEQEQLSRPSMVMHKQSAGSGSEQLCDLDGCPPLGLDVNSGHSDTLEHAHCDSLHTSQTSPQDSDPTGSEGYWPSSSLGAYAEEQLVFRVMKDNHTQPTGIQIHSTTPTRRGEISANEPATSGSGSIRSGKSTPTPSQVPVARCLSRPTLGSELGPECRPTSRAALEIMEICSVDQTGCEDPDLDSDTTAHALSELEQELRLITKETEKQSSIFDAGDTGSRNHSGNHHYTRRRVSEEQRDKEAAAQGDLQSVLLLP